LGFTKLLGLQLCHACDPKACLSGGTCLTGTTANHVLTLKANHQNSAAYQSCELKSFNVRTQGYLTPYQPDRIPNGLKSSGIKPDGSVSSASDLNVHSQYILCVSRQAPVFATSAVSLVARGMVGGGGTHALQLRHLTAPPRPTPLWGGCPFSKRC
jgi:hypothetical protein